MYMEMSITDLSHSWDLKISIEVCISTLKPKPEDSKGKPCRWDITSDAKNKWIVCCSTAYLKTMQYVKQEGRLRSSPKRLPWKRTFSTHSPKRNKSIIREQLFQNFKWDFLQMLSNFLFSHTTSFHYISRGSERDHTDVQLLNFKIREILSFMNTFMQLYRR